MLGGTLEIGTVPGGGGRITVRLPLLPIGAQARPAGGDDARHAAGTEP
jgi:hypothetical protein